MIGASTVLFVISLAIIPTIGGEFMPKLDEGALWVRSTMPYTISFEESSRIVPQIRAILRSFPEVTVVANEHGRPDDGTDPTGFFNAEFYVGLKPYSEWNGPIRNKPELIAAIDKKLEAFPGITFNYTQPAEDAVNEAETGLKSSLDVKLFGDDLATLESKGREVKQVLDSVRGITQVTLVQELGQPSLTLKIDRAKIARYGVNIADVNALIEAAVGGNAATTVAQGERTFDLVVRLEPKYRETPDAIGNIRVSTPDGQQVPLRELADIQLANGASFIYRQDNSRFIGVQYSVTGRDLAGAVKDAQEQVATRVKMPPGYRLRWGGEYEDYAASRGQLQVVLPITLTLIFLILFALYSNFKFPGITVLGVVLSAPIGGILRAQAHGDAVLGELGDRLSRAVRRERADGGRLHLVRERVAHRGEADRGGDARGRTAPAATDHDDRAGGGVRTVARGVVDGRRLGLAAAIRDRDRGRAVLATADLDLPHARALRGRREAGGSVGGIAEAVYRMCKATQTNTDGYQRRTTPA